MLTNNEKSLCSTQTPFSITHRHTSPTSWATRPSSQTAASSTPTAAGTTPIKTKCNFSTGRSLSAKTDRLLPATPSSTTAPTVWRGVWEHGAYRHCQISRSHRRLRLSQREGQHLVCHPTRIGDGIFTRRHRVCARRHNPNLSPDARLIACDVRLPNVRFYRTDVQGVCDSLTFQSRDSMIFMHRHPILWNLERQVMGNVIQIHLNDSTVDKAYLPEYGLMGEHVEEEFYNQLSGKEMIATFIDGKLRRLDVNGNVMAIMLPMEKTPHTISLSMLKAASSQCLSTDKDGETQPMARCHRQGHSPVSCQEVAVLPEGFNGMKPSVPKTATTSSPSPTSSAIFSASQRQLLQ